MDERAAIAVHELLRAVEPPLRYLAEASPKRLAANALPTAAIVERIDRALGAGAAGERRAALGRLKALFRAFPLEDETARRARAREALREVERLRAAAAEPAAYARSEPPIAPALELLSAPAQFLKGVGPRRAELLARQGLRTVEDLLYHLPFRYEDRRSLSRIAELRPGTEATCAAEIVAIGEVRAGRTGRRILEAKVSDGSGILTLTWFHQIRYFASKLAVGTRVVLHGRVDASHGRRIVHPEIEVLEGAADELGRVVPIYEKPTEMTVGVMRKIVAAAHGAVGDRVPSVLPAAVARRQGVVDLATAFRLVHEPGPESRVAELNQACSVAHRSIVFDELFFLELGMKLRKRALAEEPGTSFRPAGDLARAFLGALPFELTGAQRRVLDEIGADMAAPHPMNRLVQGDVGSGKTVVAVAAALAAIECGAQAALMAPTEVLAEQHFANVARWLAPLGVRVALLTGRVQGAERRAATAGVASGGVSFVVGTHALIQEGMRFERLGLGVIDEQHRFGVLQRKALKALGDNPDLLLMTATPIPRTLAMALWGDLDLSFLDEMPPGRQPIETRVVRERERDRVYARVREELDRGAQAYLVFPIVEENEAVDLRSAKAMARDLVAGPFAGYRLALLHGQMKSEEKDAVLRRFQAGDVQALVATTVIEVGIDVPNATVMVVDHAEQFGLAQLHQLRGRVGRGAARSLCVLVSTGRTGRSGVERLKLLEREQDGSKIAEADLEVRGPGELLGVRQSGLPDFRVANLVRDARILDEARREAEAVLRDDPSLRSDASASLREVLEHRWKERLALARVG